MLALESERPHRWTRASRIQQLCEESTHMELSEDEFTEEQLQDMTDYHSKNQTNAFAPSSVKLTADFHQCPKSHGGSMCATTGGTRSSRGGLMSANGGTRSCNIIGKGK